MVTMKKACLIAAAIILLILVVVVCIVFFGSNQPAAPDTIGPTADWEYTQEFGLLYGSKDGAEPKLLTERSDMTAIGEDRVFYIEGDVLYSLNADGSGKFKITNHCVANAYPDALLDRIADHGDQVTQARTLGYYNGYVYVVVNSAHKAHYLARYANGTRNAERVTEADINLFVISEDGILYGFHSSNNLMEAETAEPLYELLCEIDLNSLTAN